MSDTPNNSIEIKSATLSLTKIRLRRPNIETFREQIRTICQQAPKLLVKSNIVIDFELVSRHLFTTPELLEIKSIITHSGAFFLGVQNLTGAQTEAAHRLQIPIIHEPQINRHKPKPDRHSQHPAVILDRVRTGTEFHSDSDLIVLGNVAPGSCITANGNIYVFGTCSGRVLFGLKSQSPTKLIAQQFDPELLGTPFHYIGSNNIDSHLRGRQVCCSLDPQTETLTYSKQNSPPFYHD